MNYPFISRAEEIREDNGQWSVTSGQFLKGAQRKRIKDERTNKADVGGFILTFWWRQNRHSEDIT